MLTAARHPIQLKSISLWHIVVTGFLLLVMMPIMVILSSFLKTSGVSVADLGLRTVIGNTLMLAAGVAVGATALGVGLAWLVTQFEFPGRRFFSWVLMLPLAFPNYVLAFVLIGIFDFTGPVQTWVRSVTGLSGTLIPIRSFGGLILVLCLSLYPYIYLICRNAFESQGARPLELAQSMGYSTLKAFFKAVLPAAWPWVMAGVALVLMEVIADFGTVSVFNIDTFTTAIFKAWFGYFSLGAAARLSGILLVLAFGLVLFEQKIRQKQRYTQIGKDRLTPNRIQLTGMTKWTAVSVCFGVFLIGFGLPGIQLIAWSIEGVQSHLFSGYWVYLKNSLELAGLGALAVTVGAALLAIGRRVRNTGYIRFAARFSTLGYAVPGTVLAVGLFIPIAGLDRILGGHLVIKGTILMMILAFITRFMAVSFRTVSTSLERISDTMEQSAQSLGASQGRILRTLYFPLVRSGLGAGIILVFVEILKEMPITLMTRPFGWDTLSVKIFEFTQEGQWEMAAFPSLMLVGTGLVAIALLNKISYQPTKTSLKEGIRT